MAMQRLKLYQNQLSLSTPKVSVQHHFDNTIAVVTMNSPSDLNALSEQMRQELLNAFIPLERCEKTKVVILQSSVPKAFCAGVNIKEFLNTTTESFSRDEFLEPIHSFFSQFRKPLIAAVNGVALGGGFELALCADIIICSEEARFGLPEIKLGLIPGMGGTQRFTKIVGKVIANRYIMTGDFISSSQAKNLNVVSEVYKSDVLQKEALSLAKRLSDLSMYSLIAAKKAVEIAEDSGLSVGIKHEKQLFLTLLNTKGKEEGTSAFVAKRKPNFKDI